MLNHCAFIGNLGRDPEMTYTPGGKAVSKFSLAVNTRRGSGEARQEETLWLNVVCWERLAEVASSYLRKGSKAYIAGRLQVREYDRKDGGKGTSVELVCSELVLLDAKNGGTGTGTSAQGAEDVPDGVPF